MSTNPTTDPLARWREGDRHWTEGVDPAAADNLYNEIAGITGRVEQYDPKIASQLWRSEGFGARDKNMQAMVGDLQRHGVNSLSDLKVEERDVTKQANLQMGADGRVMVIEDRGETMSTRPATEQELAALKADPKFAETLEQFEKEKARPRAYDDGFSGVNFTAELPTGQKTGSLINARTGAVIDDNKDNSPLEQGFYLGKTAAGKGKTHFNLYPVQTKGPDGTTQYNFIPGTINKATGFNKFMQDFGPVLGMASLVMGLPGVAAGMGTAGTAVATGLKGINALGAFHSGNPLAGIASLAGMAPGVNQLGNLGLSADTMKTIGTIGQGANLGQAVQNKNWLGALSTGANMAGVKEVGGVPVKQGLHGLAALDAATKGDYLRAATSGLRATGAQHVPGTEVPVDDAIKGVNLYNAIRTKNPLSALDAAVRLGSEPQSTIRRASGGVVPDLSQYMRTLPNGSRTDKLRGIAAIANGA
jgi:hypothetical protein